jgi:hypothetical protein
MCSSWSARSQRRSKRPAGAELAGRNVVRLETACCPVALDVKLKELGEQIVADHCQRPQRLGALLRVQLAVVLDVRRARFLKPTVVRVVQALHRLRELRHEGDVVERLDDVAKLHLLLGPQMAAYSPLGVVLRIRSESDCDVKAARFGAGRWVRWEPRDRDAAGTYVLRVRLCGERGAHGAASATGPGTMISTSRWATCKTARSRNTTMTIVLEPAAALIGSISKSAGSFEPYPNIGRSGETLQPGHCTTKRNSAPGESDGSFEMNASVCFNALRQSHSPTVRSSSRRRLTCIFVPLSPLSHAFRYTRGSREAPMAVRLALTAGDCLPGAGPMLPMCGSGTEGAAGAGEKARCSSRRAF